MLFISTFISTLIKFSKATKTPFLQQVYVCIWHFPICIFDFFKWSGTVRGRCIISTAIFVFKSGEKVVFVVGQYLFVGFLAKKTFMKFFVVVQLVQPRSHVVKRYGWIVYRHVFIPPAFVRNRIIAVFQGTVYKGVRLGNIVRQSNVVFLSIALDF